MLFGWGANSYGQLGLGYKCEQILTPELINLEILNGSKIISICGGAGHSIILDENGYVYSSGWNTKGQLGKEEETLKFTKINELSNHKIRQISCGWDFNAAINENNEIFVWGSNHFSQLGLTKTLKFTSKPTVLDGIRGKYISCGLRHMAIVTIEGKILICGNGSKGQLGITENDKPVREIGLKYIPELNSMIQVSCGQNHTLALKSDGKVYCWGNNKHGQLGLDPSLHEDSFIPIQLPFDLPVQRIWTGWTHSAILTQNGEVYNFGRNTYGQLGSERENNWIPTKVNVDCIQKLSLGSEHNLAINSEDKVFCWGWNEHGNCGTGNVEDVKTPTEILINYKPLIVSCGTGQSFAVTKNCVI